MAAGLSPKAAVLLAAIQARGCDATDLRDAAHEASHALETDLDKKWTRNNIHRAVMRFRRGDQAASEVLARAVEQIVCAEFGAPCESVEACTMTACLEAATYRLPFLSYEQALSAIRNAMKGERANALACQVLGLAS